MPAGRAVLPADRGARAELVGARFGDLDDHPLEPQGAADAVAAARGDLVDVVGAAEARRQLEEDLERLAAAARLEGALGAADRSGRRVGDRDGDRRCRSVRGGGRTPARRSTGTR